MTLLDVANPKIHSTKFAAELAFTDTYHRHMDDHPAIREAHCLKTQFEHLFDPIRPGDLFAGRTHYLAVGFGLEDAAGGPVYYCYPDRFGQDPSELPPDVRDMLEFWKTEATINGKLVHSLPADTLQATSNHIAEMGGRLSGTLLNFEKLTRLGLPGLRDGGHRRARQDTATCLIYQGMDMALDLLAEVIRRYAADTAHLAKRQGMSRAKETISK